MSVPKYVENLFFFNKVQVNVPVKIMLHTLERLIIISILTVTPFGEGLDLPA